MNETQRNDRRPTILEVARLAGVSHQTVSRHLRFKGDGLKPATRARVDAAIRELNYRPNLVARSMRTRTTGRVAVLIPAMAFNPARMLAGAMATAHAAGYVVDVMSFEGGAAARTDRILELAGSRQVDGIVSLAPILPDTPELLSGDAMVVVSADFDDEMRGIGELAGGTPVAQLIEGLAGMGHRRFYHVAGSDQFASARGRRQTYLETVERLGLESVGVFDGDWSGESGIEAVSALDERAAPTAIIAANDIVAAGVIRGAMERGWNVPGDISVTGWDNNPVGKYFFPSLTTVQVNLEMVGANAMARLIAALGGESTAVATTPLNELIWRESTSPPQH